MSATVKVFMSGRSQAICLHAKVRLQAQEVRIEQIGDALWLQAQQTPDANLGQWL